MSRRFGSKEYDVVIRLLREILEIEQRWITLPLRVLDFLLAVRSVDLQDALEISAVFSKVASCLPEGMYPTVFDSVAQSQRKS